jgi:NADH:ubiquinone oxidoreductase subunit H
MIHFCLVETNCTSFAFAEGESESIFGYNIEYEASEFHLFLAEYARIIL